MAHNMEPMDIDNIESDFDNKENSIHHSNVYPRTPCTEKGYEELDVSELNMKLRYSITPASSPMSKSFTANCTDHRSLESGDDIINSNLTRSLHSTISKADVSSKSVKVLPLQTILTEQFVESNRNASVLRPLDATSVIDNNVTITVTGGNDVDENVSFPSSSSSITHTPEATTPTKDIPRNDGGSPIMRGLKSVLNMFRSSQSPIPPADNADGAANQVLSPANITGTTSNSSSHSASPAVLASTPLATNKHKESNMSKRSSPLKESLVFNEDLEKELLWKDETTILFSQEKIPIHKLFFQQGALNMKEQAKSTEVDTTVEYMDVSFNDSMVKNRTITELQVEAMHANESDAEFVDCETTFTNDKPDVIDPVDKVNDESKLTSTVTEMISAINVANPSTNTETAVKVEPPSDGENFSGTELRQPDLTTSLKDDNINIPQVTSEPERKYSEKDTYINTTNNASNFTQQMNDIDSSVNFKNNGKIIEKNDKPEFNVPLDVTFDTLNLLDKSSTVDDVGNEPVINFNKLQLDMTYEASRVPTDVEIILSSASIPAEETKISETYNNTVSDSTVLNIEINAKSSKESENAPIIHINNTDVNVKDENKLNVANAFEIEILDLPANTPLPDDEDAENEKSIGAVVLIEEGTVPCGLDINSTNATGLEYLEQVENVPTGLAKSIDVNNTMKDCFAIKNSIATNCLNKSEPIRPSKSNNEGNNDNISVEINPIQENIIPVEMLPIIESSDNSKSNSDVHVMDVHQNTVIIENNMNLKMEQVSDAKDKSLILDSQILLKPQTDVISTSISEKSQIKAEETEINDNETPHVPDCSFTKEGTRHEHESAIKMEDNITMNNTATFSDIVDKKEKEQQCCVNESQKYDIFNKTALISDFVLEKRFTEESIGIESNVEESIQIKEISGKSENIFTAEATPTPSNDICNLSHNSKTVNNEQVAVEQSIDTEITNPKEEIEHDVVNDIVERVENKDEEILLSENNRPYVSLAGKIDQVPDQLNFEEPENQFATKTKVVLTPPSSPKIVSKGYNFNFDEIDDPFATKTKIRTSPTPETPERPLRENDKTFTERRPQRDVNKNRRKSQPERKKPMPKNKMNTTFSGSVNVLKTTSYIKPEVIEQVPDVIENQFSGTIDDKDIQAKLQQEKKTFDLELLAPIEIDKTNIVVAVTETPSEIMPQELTNKDIKKEEKSVDVRDIDTTIEVNEVENKSSAESLNKRSNETINTSSSEHSTYYSAGTSSGEGAVSRNVFNLPEIDDMNFNPFVTKSKMRQSPPLVLNPSAAVNTMQELVSSSDTALKPTSTENPFETKSKMRQSPPPSLNASAILSSTQEFSCSSNIILNIKSDTNYPENPFEPKSKMRQSSPPCLNATAILNATQELPCSDNASKLKADATFTEVDTGEFEINNIEKKTVSSLDEKEYADISSTTCSSKATDDKDLTVREVNTEDEDTVEGPFLEAEESNNDDKMSDFDGEDVDMMQFSELPAQSSEENVDGGELFIDAEAFEFLLNQNKTNIVADSGKESLFLKFDPLFAKRMSSDGVLAALNKKRQSTPKKMSAAVQMDATFDKSIAGPSSLDITHEVATNSSAEGSTDDFNVTVSKPMMVVTPAVNPVVTTRNRTATPPSSNRRSITFTSPAIAVIDRLLSLSANNSLVGHDMTVTHMSREQAEADLALTQLRELLAEKEINVYNLRTESKALKDRLSSMESQMRILESEGQDRLKKINDLNEKLSEKIKLNKSMAAVVEEYERTIASLIAETEQDKKRNNEERIRLIKERDEQTAHLASMEVSFSDLHSKYEKSKQIILTCKANEDSYKKSIKEFEENLTKMQSNYELLKQHATSKLNHANQELEKMNRSHEAEVLKLNAMIKRKELHITSLEETLAQKTKANEELTAICDELINKVG